MQVDIKDTGFSLKSSIPVLRMLDEAKSKAFYLDFLGYEIDWEHRFRDDESSPLYMQIHQGDSVLHLNGHASENDPVCEVRVPVEGLLRFCEHLRSKSYSKDRPEIVDPRYEGRPADLNIIDPSGNQLVFWRPTSMEE